MHSPRHHKLKILNIGQHSSPTQHTRHRALSALWRGIASKVIRLGVVIETDYDDNTVVEDLACYSVDFFIGEEE
jgi:hypothetical protein